LCQIDARAVFFVHNRIATAASHLLSSYWMVQEPLCPKNGGYAAVLALAGRKARRSRGAKHGAKRTLEDSGDAHAAQRPYNFEYLGFS
jgi:hypothetical protein